MKNHLMETTEAGTRCSRCLRTPAELYRRSKSCPGKPWFLRYSAPKHLQTKSQLHQGGLRATGPVVGYVVNAYSTLVKLYDVAETTPVFYPHLFKSAMASQVRGQNEFETILLDDLELILVNRPGKRCQPIH